MFSNIILSNFFKNLIVEIWIQFGRENLQCFPEIDKIQGLLLLLWIIKKIKSLFASKLVGVPLIDGGINLLVSPLSWWIYNKLSKKKKRIWFPFSLGSIHNSLIKENDLHMQSTFLNVL